MRYVSRRKRGGANRSFKSILGRKKRKCERLAERLKKKNPRSSQGLPDGKDLSVRNGLGKKPGHTYKGRGQKKKEEGGEREAELSSGGARQYGRVSRWGSFQGS